MNKIFRRRLRAEVMSNSTTHPDGLQEGQDADVFDRNSPEQEAAFGTSLVRWRRLRGFKQSHVAELCGTSQASYSRLERGLRQPLPRERRHLRSLMAARPDGGSDRALIRLVRNSNSASHLICDLTHRLLCASSVREHEWRVSSASLTGTSLWGFATDETVRAEARLHDQGWFDEANISVELSTGKNNSNDVPIRPGRTRWTRMQLADGSFARLVESIVSRV
jgi:hypothetical protein